MKRLVLGLLFLNSFVFALADTYVAKHNTLLCYSESDAIPSAIAVGIQNIDVVKDYMTKKKCIFIDSDTNMKFKIIQSKKVPQGKSYVPVHKIKIIESTAGKAPKNMPYFWMGDIMRRYEKK